MLRAPDSSWFHQMDNILLGVQTMRPLIIQSCPVPCYVIPLTPDSFLNTREKQQAKL